MKKTCKILTIVSIFIVTALMFISCSESADVLNPNNVKLDHNNPTTIVLWHYYNGDQQDAFDELVDEFNETAGKEKGIIVSAASQGNVSELEKKVIDSVNQKVGVKPLPNIFGAYADTAYAVDRLGYAVDISPYFTNSKIDMFVESYIEEGRFGNNDGLKLFPIAKSTEIFMLNKTDWDKFADSTGASIDELKTYEGLVRTAKAYYEWTDSLTPEPNDGKAFFGRDAAANHLIIGAKQLGTEIFSINDGNPVINFDKETIRKIWDNYYTPFISGYFASSGRYRSDDIKTGLIISCVGSSAAATYFPSEVIISDTESYDIEMITMEAPQFENSQPHAVQQGAGMVVVKSNAKEEYASVVFLDWFVKEERNIRFSVSSGYMPVMKSANDIEKIKQNTDKINEIVMSVIKTSIDTVNNNNMYTSKAFVNSNQARNILGNSFTAKATEDRASVVHNMNVYGFSLDEAVSQFDSDANFEIWYNEVNAELESLIKDTNYRK